MQPTKKPKIAPKMPALMPMPVAQRKVAVPAPVKKVITVAPAPKSTPVKAPDSTPAPATAPVRTWWYVILAASTLLFAVTAYLAHKHTLVGWELHVFRAINDWPNSLRLYFLVATIAPESLWIGVGAVGITFLLKLYRLTWQMAAAILGGFALAEVGKKLIGRARPVELVHNIHLRASDSGNGYPSGHTMIVTVIVLTLWPYLPRGWRWLTLLLIPLVGLSRIYLGLHAPLDIVGGFAAGAIVVSCMRVLPSIMRNFFRLD